jgi:hypothetical protein
MELKSTQAWGCRCSILRHKFSSHTFSPPSTYSPFYILVVPFIIRETFGGIRRRRWGGKLDFGASMRPEAEFRNVQFR